MQATLANLLPIQWKALIWAAMAFTSTACTFNVNLNIATDKPIALNVAIEKPIAVKLGAEVAITKLPPVKVEPTLP
jgi:hypothetical protein